MSESSKTKINTSWIKPALIIVGIIVALVVVIAITKVAVLNSAYQKEEQIGETNSQITIQLDARNRKISQMVQVVERYAEHEKSIMESVAEARSYSDGGEDAQAYATLKAIVEKYPDLKAISEFDKLNKEIILCEQEIANARTTYNAQIKEYRKFVRNPVNSYILNSQGYEIIDDSEYFDVEDKESLTEIGELF